MTVNYTDLKKTHAEVAVCCDCKQKFADASFSVVCPPDVRYPPPPSEVRVLFIGVAPPGPGKHFYAPTNDGLRQGLFSVLCEAGYACSSVNDFHAHGFYLSHTAKCPIANTSEPVREVCVFCSSKHLPAEIRALQPSAICFLSKTTGLASWLAIAESLCYRKAIRAGEPFEVVIDERLISGLVTGWPGRGGLSACRRDLPAFLNRIQLSKK